MIFDCIILGKSFETLKSNKKVIFNVLVKKILSF
jgi:hypothetical protein